MESAGVPSGLQTLADNIRQCPDWLTGFREASPGEAEAWLRQHLATELRLFLVSFGHRCLKEFELMSRPWAENLEPVIKTLQAMLSPHSARSSQAKHKTAKLINHINVLL